MIVFALNISDYMYPGGVSNDLEELFAADVYSNSYSSRLGFAVNFQRPSRSHLIFGIMSSSMDFEGNEHFPLL